MAASLVSCILLLEENLEWITRYLIDMMDNDEIREMEVALTEGGWGEGAPGADHDDGGSTDEEVQSYFDNDPTPDYYDNIPEGYDPFGYKNSSPIPSTSPSTDGNEEQSYNGQVIEQNECHYEDAENYEHSEGEAISENSEDSIVENLEAYAIPENSEGYVNAVNSEADAIAETIENSSSEHSEGTAEYSSEENMSSWSIISSDSDESDTDELEVQLNLRWLKNQGIKSPPASALPIPMFDQPTEILRMPTEVPRAPTPQANEDVGNSDVDVENYDNNAGNIDDDANSDDDVGNDDDDAENDNDNAENDDDDAGNDDDDDENDNDDIKNSDDDIENSDDDIENSDVDIENCDNATAAPELTPNGNEIKDMPSTTWRLFPGIGLPWKKMTNLSFFSTESSAIWAPTANDNLPTTPFVSNAQPSVAKRLNSEPSSSGVSSANDCAANLEARLAARANPYASNGETEGPVGFGPVGQSRPKKATVTKQEYSNAPYNRASTSHMSFNPYTNKSNASSSNRQPRVGLGYLTSSNIASHMGNAFQNSTNDAPSNYASVMNTARMPSTTTSRNANAPRNDMDMLCMPSTSSTSRPNINRSIINESWKESNRPTRTFHELMTNTQWMHSNHTSRNRSSVNSQNISLSIDISQITPPIHIPSSNNISSMGNSGRSSTNIGFPNILHSDHISPNPNNNFASLSNSASASNQWITSTNPTLLNNNLSLSSHVPPANDFALLNNALFADASWVPPTHGAFRLASAHASAANSNSFRGNAQSGPTLDPHVKEFFNKCSMRPQQGPQASQAPQTSQVPRVPQAPPPSPQSMAHRNPRTHSELILQRLLRMTRERDEAPCFAEYRD